jgi:CRISPR/Cas system CSM-associated protein Csm3 (group 7 of RAMP superfamily)
MSPRDYGPSAPKPYDFVEIESLEAKDRKKPIGHDRYEADAVSGRLEAMLIVATPLHVSSGRIKMRQGKEPPLVREMTRVNGDPCVPASTLKGVVRSIVEAITRSCVRVSRAPTNQLPAGAGACRDAERLCLACRMFGALGFEGHVRFGDAVLHEGELAIARMPALYAPRTRTRAYFAGNDVKGRKFYEHGQTVIDSQTPVEVLKPEAELSFQVRFENLTSGQLGVLLTGLGLGNPELVLKLGGGKPACYGSAIVRLDRLLVSENTQTLFSSYETDYESSDVSLYLSEARSLLQEDKLKSLAQIWRYDTNRHCPDGNY